MRPTRYIFLILLCGIMMAGYAAFAFPPASHAAEINTTFYPPIAETSDPSEGQPATAVPLQGMQGKNSGTPAGLYAYDRLSPSATRLMLLNALIIGFLGLALSSDTLRRSFAELGNRLAIGAQDRFIPRKMKKETYESQHH